jgi:hypothetical protein
MVALAPRQDARPRIRDHGRFWLSFAVLVLAGLLTVWLAFLVLGATPAGLILLAEGMIGLGLGIR